MGTTDKVSHRRAGLCPVTRLLPHTPLLQPSPAPSLPGPVQCCSTVPSCAHSKVPPESNTLLSYPAVLQLFSLISLSSSIQAHSLPTFMSPSPTFPLPKHTSSSRGFGGGTTSGSGPSLKTGHDVTSTHPYNFTYNGSYLPPHCSWSILQHWASGCVSPAFLLLAQCRPVTPLLQGPAQASRNPS